MPSMALHAQTTVVNEREREFPALLIILASASWTVYSENLSRISI